MQSQNVKTKNEIVIEGPLLLIPEVFEDERGFFMKVGIKMLLTKY